MPNCRIFGVFTQLTKSSLTIFRRSLSAIMSEQKHLKCKVVENVAVIIINSPRSKVNMLTSEVMDEITTILNHVELSSTLHSSVLISGKPDCFLAGADLNSLLKFKNSDDGYKFCKEGQETVIWISKCKKPVVAAIQGSCLGGGLSIAMACHFRLALQDSKTEIGYPVVKLGLLPGWGGTQNLLKLASLPDALDVALSGKSLKVDEAKKIGLVDLIVKDAESGIEKRNVSRILEETAINIARDLSIGKLKISRSSKLFEDKDRIFEEARLRALRKSQASSLAQLKILNVMRVGLDQGSAAGFEEEAKDFGELVVSSEAKGHISLFFSQKRCRKNRFGDPTNSVKTLGIVGAGLMGSGIGYISIKKGLKVVMKDANKPGMQRGVDRIEQLLESSVKRNDINRLEKDKCLENLNSTTKYDSFKQVDMVVEAVFEDINVKHKVIKEVEAITPDHCIIATNTSAISIADIAAGSSRPKNIIGMHYFSPVDKMQLLEVVTHEKTSLETIQKAIDVGLKQGKVVITVRDAPGFYTTRIFNAMKLEGIRLLQEGVDPEYLDALTKSFGFPVGLATLTDEIGIDVGAHIAVYLAKALGERFHGGSIQIFQDMTKTGYLGRKSGKGFFIYETGSKTRDVNKGALEVIKKYSLTPKGSISKEDRQMRLISRFVNEAVLCLQENILANPIEGDVGAAFGLGFPSSTGGPFRWIDWYGADKLVKKMEEFQSHYGVAFKACDLLYDMSLNPERKFY